MHSSEFLMELVADPDYRQFPAYGIGGKSGHDYLDVFFYRADAVRQDKIEGYPVRSDYTCAGEQCVLSESTVLSPVFRVEYMA